MGFIQLRIGLRALRVAINKLSDAIKEYSSAIYAQNEARKTEKLPIDPQHVIVSYDEETARNTKHEQDRQHRTQNSIKKAAWCAFVAAVIYAGIAAFQWNEMRNATVISREALESVQRAFVSFQHFEYLRIQDPDRSDVHTWNITAIFENGGTTNAMNVVGIIKVKELPLEPTDEQFRGEYTQLIPWQ